MAKNSHDTTKFMRGLRTLKSKGCTVEFKEGACFKVYPPDRSKKKYSGHVGQRGVQPLVRFASEEWGIFIDPRDFQ